LAVAPDVQSWSIFLEGFTRHGQLKLAEQVLTYMRGKGLEPNSVTWNTLLAGYASQQDFDGMLGAMRRLDASGHAWDEWTYNGLRRYRNAEQLKGVMERRAQTMQLDFTDDLKQGLGARLSKEAV
jgi:pentatricopeptide repeat protein